MEGQALTDADVDIQPGDTLEVDSAEIDGRKVVVLRPRRIDHSWIGRLRVRSDAPHGEEYIRASVGRGAVRSR